jgi:transposase
VIRIRQLPIDVQLSATTLLNPEDPSNPLFVNVREQTNNQFDFVEFVMECIESKSLTEGDTLVLDNATIHRSKDSFPVLKEALRILGIKVVFLPKYSPELNPCELVFNVVKRQLKGMKRTSNFVLEVFHAFARVDIHFIQKCYAHCANNVFSQSPFVSQL